MRVVIAGGHGKIALLLSRLLTAGGHHVVGLVRDRDQFGDLAAVGAQGVVCDLETAEQIKVAEYVAGAGAVVFAAGAGPGSGDARKATMDYGGSVLLADACEQANVRRFVQVSAMGLDDLDPHGTEPGFPAYLRAKYAAEENLRRRADLEWTIVRPGRLTDDPATGRVHLRRHVPPGEVPRADVAAVLAAVLQDPRTVGMTLELVAAEDGLTVAEAVAALGEGTGR